MWHGSRSTLSTSRLSGVPRACETRGRRPPVTSAGGLLAFRGVGLSRPGARGIQPESDRERRTGRSDQGRRRDRYRRALSRLPGLALHYIVLRPDRAVTLRRARQRTASGALVQEGPVLSLWDQFADLGELEGHAFVSTLQSGADTVRAVRDAVTSERCRPFASSGDGYSIRDVSGDSLVRILRPHPVAAEVSSSRHRFARTLVEQARDLDAADVGGLPGRTSPHRAILSTARTVALAGW